MWLRDMEDSQLETTLLRSCLALPKVSYVLRTCPPSHIARATMDFDATIMESLESILGGPCSEWSWLKASLPSSRGGINLRSTSLHAPAAFVASSTRAEELVGRMLGHSPRHSPHLAQALAALSTSASRPNWQQPEDVDVPGRQRHLSLAIDEATHHQLMSSAPSIRARALALSTALPHAGDWLNGVPSAALGLRLQDREFRSCLRYWLGVPLHSAPYSCPECRATADEFGDHQVGCGGNGDRISRHNTVRDVLYSAAQSAALAPTREAIGVVPNSHSRPADILLPTWRHGRPTALDVHIISPLQQSTVHEAASTPGHALEVGVQCKLAAHLSACRSIGVDFLPIVAEALGGLGQVVRSIGESIAQRISYQDASTPSSFSDDSPSPCGGGMRAFGSTVILPSPPLWTVSFGFVLFFFVFCFFLLFSCFFVFFCFFLCVLCLFFCIVTVPLVHFCLKQYCIVLCCIYFRFWHVKKKIKKTSRVSNQVVYVQTEAIR